MQPAANNLHLWQRQFLETRRHTTPRPMLDVAAHLLFYVTEPATLHGLALEHLLTKFEADRTDLGFSSVHDETYTPQADCRASADVPTVQSFAFPNLDPGVQVVWRSPGGVCMDVPRDPLVKNIRPMMLEVLGMQAKLAHRLEYGGQVFGMVCIDQVDHRRAWREGEQAYLHQFLQEVLSPILAASRELQKQPTPLPSDISLTKAERQVLTLLESGLTSKEIARHLGKSPNTIDNQLSTLRQKLGVRNKVELLRVWAQLERA